MDTATKNGFFSSNRKEDNLGSDDIYKCSETIPVPKDCQQSLTGLLVDAETKLLMPGVKVVLYDINYVKIDELITDQNGKFDFGQVACETKFRIQFEQKEYASKETLVITPKDSGITDVLIELTPNLQPLQVGRDLRKTLGIDIIYLNGDDVVRHKLVKNILRAYGDIQ